MTPPPVCVCFKTKRRPWGAKLYLAPATFRSQYLRADDALGLGPQAYVKSFAKKRAAAKCDENRHFGRFQARRRNLGAADEHSGSVKRSLRAGLAWKKRGNGSVASACDAKTGIQA